MQETNKKVDRWQGHIRDIPHSEFPASISSIHHILSKDGSISHAQSPANALCTLWWTTSSFTCLWSCQVIPCNLINPVLFMKSKELHREVISLNKTAEYNTLTSLYYYFFSIRMWHRQVFNDLHFRKRLYYPKFCVLTSAKVGHFHLCAQINLGTK